MKKIIVAILLVGVLAMPFNVANAQQTDQERNQVILKQLIAAYAQLIVLFQQQVQAGTVAPGTLDEVDDQVRDIREEVEPVEVPEEEVPVPSVPLPSPVDPSRAPCNYSNCPVSA